MCFLTTQKKTCTSVIQFKLNTAILFLFGDIYECYPESNIYPYMIPVQFGPLFVLHLISFSGEGDNSRDMVHVCGFHVHLFAAVLFALSSQNDSLVVIN